MKKGNMERFEEDAMNRVAPTALGHKQGARLRCGKPIICAAILQLRSSLRKLAPHLLGLVGFFVAGIINGLIYMLIVNKLLGLGGEGCGNAAAVVTFPLFGLSVGSAWMLLWVVHEQVAKRMALHRVIILGLALGLFASLIVVGPDGFALRGGSALINYFLIDLTGGGAIIHHLLLDRMSENVPPVT